jgi:hypothetical protein
MLRTRYVVFAVLLASCTGSAAVDESTTAQVRWIEETPDDTTVWAEAVVEGDRITVDFASAKNPTRPLWMEVSEDASGYESLGIVVWATGGLDLGWFHHRDWDEEFLIPDALAGEGSPTAWTTDLGALDAGRYVACSDAVDGLVCARFELIE